MKNEDLVVLIECGNWFVREDGFVQIRNKKGQLVILNEELSKVWENIGFERKLTEIVSELSGVMDEKMIDDCLENLKKSDLVKIYEKGNSFDLMFS